MRELLDQIDEAVKLRLHYMALFTALIIPDIAGGLGELGSNKEARYRAWVRQNLPRWSASEQTLALYKYRCSLLHDGTAEQHPQSKIPRLVFFHSTGGRQPAPVDHIVLGPPGPLSSKDIEVIDVDVFCQEMTAAGRSWLGRMYRTEPVRSNLRTQIRTRPSGWPPYIALPVIT